MARSIYFVVFALCVIATQAIVPPSDGPYGPSDGPYGPDGPYSPDNGGSNIPVMDQYEDMSIDGGIPTFPNGTLYSVLLTDAIAQGAQCLDGSAPNYYFRQGSGSGVNSWILFFEGGGWCCPTPNATCRADTCESRSQGSLGSTKNDGPNMTLGYEGGWSMNSAPSVNPLTYNWNTAYLRYCDGASFGGNASEPVVVNGKTLYYRGLRVFQAIFDSLIERGMKSADNVIVTGCSAGGLATYLHCQSVADQMKAFNPNVNVKCWPDAGFFINVTDIAGENMVDDYYHNVVDGQQVYDALDSNCVAQQPAGQSYKCFFPENIIKTLKTPLFIWNSGYDSWQTFNTWLAMNYTVPPSGSPQNECAGNLNKCTPELIAAIQSYHQQMLDKLAPVTDASSPHGVFLDSCLTHCQSGGDLSQVTLYNGLNAVQAFQLWWEGKLIAKQADKAWPAGGCGSALAIQHYEGRVAN